MGLIRDLVGSGHTVVAVAPEDSYTEHIVDAGCEFVNLTMDSRGINPIKDVALTWELYKIYKRIEPDVILHFTIKPNIYGSLAARMLKIPVINNVSGLGTVFLWKNFASSLALWMYRIAFSSVNYVFFQNNDDRQHFLNRVGIKDLKTGILPGSGIDVSAFAPSAREHTGPFTFLLIARLLVDKGIEEYVKAVRLLKNEGFDAKFQLLGSIETGHKRGVSLAKVKEWMSEGLIDYMGKTNDVVPFIERADCVVLPSYREGTPRTLLEGASLAKPLIATDVPGCNSVVMDGKNGFLVKVKDPEDLAEKMKMMLSLNKDELVNMGDHSRQLVVQNFDEHLVINKYREAIKEFSKVHTVGTKDKTKKKKFHSQAAALNL